LHGRLTPAAFLGAGTLLRALSGELATHGHCVGWAAGQGPGMLGIYWAMPLAPALRRCCCCCHGLAQRVGSPLSTRLIAKRNMLLGQLSTVAEHKHTIYILTSMHYYKFTTGNLYHPHVYSLGEHRRACCSVACCSVACCSVACCCPWAPRELCIQHDSTSPWCPLPPLAWGPAGVRHSGAGVAAAAAAVCLWEHESERGDEAPAAPWVVGEWVTPAGKPGSW
jgi:hypothetical protein